MEKQDRRQRQVLGGGGDVALHHQSDLQLMAAEPFWKESDCDFMVWTQAPTNPKEDPSTFNSVGTQFCIADENGGFVAENKKRDKYLFSVHRGLLRVEGYFSVLGDIEGAHFGINSVGLSPATREFGHERL